MPDAGNETTGPITSRAVSEEMKKHEELERALEDGLKEDEEVYSDKCSGGIIQYSMHILRQQERLGGGVQGKFSTDQWRRFKKKMKGDSSAISKYTTVAKCPLMTNKDNWPYFPASLNLLYELAVYLRDKQISAEQFEELVDVIGNDPYSKETVDQYHDTIHSHMTRDDVAKLAGKKTAAERAKEKKQRDAENQRVLEEEHVKAAMQIQQSQTPTASASVAPSAPAAAPSESASETPVAAQRPQEPEPPASQSASVVAPSSSFAMVVEPEEREDGQQDAVEEPPQPATEEPEPTPEEIGAAQDMQDAEGDNDIIVCQNFMNTYQQLQLRRLVKKFMKDNQILYKTVEIEITITKEDEEPKSVKPATQKKQINRRKK